MDRYRPKHPTIQLGRKKQGPTTVECTFLTASFNVIFFDFAHICIYIVVTFSWYEAYHTTDTTIN
jgi:hypothetical protein